MLNVCRWLNKIVNFLSGIRFLLDKFLRAKRLMTGYQPGQTLCNKHCQLGKYNELFLCQESYTRISSWSPFWSAGSHHIPWVYIYVPWYYSYVSRRYPYVPWWCPYDELKYTYDKWCTTVSTHCHCFKLLVKNGFSKVFPALGLSFL